MPTFSLCQIVLAVDRRRLGRVKVNAERDGKALHDGVGHVTYKAVAVVSRALQVGEGVQVGRVNVIVLQCSLHSCIAATMV